MKKLIQLVVFGLMIVAFTPKANAQSPKSDLTTVHFTSSMDCHNCELTLTNYLKFEKGVKDLKVDWKANTIKVVYKSGKNTPETIQKGIEKKGYEAEPITELQYKTIMEKADKK
jgi:copper chaperone CopZ